MRMVKRVLKFLDKHTEEYMMGALLVALTVVMLLQVCMRYVFNASLSWPEEFCRYCFVYFSFFTLGYCVRNDSMLRLDFFKNLFSKKTGEIVQIVISLICLGFFAYMLFYSFQLVDSVQKTSRTSPAMGIPFFYIYLSTIIGFALAVVRSIQYLYHMIGDLLHKTNGEENR